MHDVTHCYGVSPSSNTVITLSTGIMYERASGVTVGRQSPRPSNITVYAGWCEIARRNWHCSLSGVGSLESDMSHAAF
jgi:hypothetical protein